MKATQICTKCSIEKPFSDYCKAKGYATGYQRICRECGNAHKRNRYHNDPSFKEKQNQTSTLWQKKNSKLVLERVKKRQRENREHVLALRKEWRTRNKEKLAEQRKALYQKDPQKHIQRNLTTKRANRKYYREYHKEYCKVYYAQPDKKLSHSVTVLMNRMLKRGKEGKSWRNYVDYSLEELKAHLERQFQPGMSWDNYGEWHVDHIIPRVSFSCTEPTDEDFKKCWALSNLQPLWKTENLSKGSKILVA